MTYSKSEEIVVDCTVAPHAAAVGVRQLSWSRPQLPGQGLELFMCLLFDFEESYRIQRLLVLIAVEER